MRLRLLSCASLLLLPIGASDAAELPELALDQTQQGTSNVDAPAVYQITISGPGILTVAARADEGLDLGIKVTDSVGQVLPDGFGDWDNFDLPGKEQVAATLGSAGSYRVYIDAYESSTDYVIGASFLPMPEAALPEDPQGKPGTAMTLTAGQRLGGTVRPARGDHYDWFTVQPERDGQLTAFTRGQDDLVLEAYYPDDFHEAAAGSDGSDPISPGNESVTLDVREGEPVYFRVSTYDQPADYMLQTGMLETEPQAHEPASGE